MSMSMALTLFLVATAIFLLGLVLPLVETSLSRRAVQPAEKAVPRANALPTVEVVVPAYLESSVIAEKIVDLREALNSYRGQSIITVVASDRNTAKAALGADRVYEIARNGKPAAVNFAIDRSEADIVVLSDANCRIEPSDWPDVTVDELQRSQMVSAHKKERGGHEALFWKFEESVKNAGSRDGNLSVVGEFVAFRRRHFRPIPPRIVCDDLWLALDFDERALRVTVSSLVSTTEQSAERNEQWERRVRIAEGVLTQQLPQLRRLVRTLLGRRFIVHKLYRLTLGNIGFWVAIASFAALFPPVTLPLAIGGSAWAVAWYSGHAKMPSTLTWLGALIGMQAVPPAAVFRAFWKRLVRRAAPQVAGWKKVVR